MTDESSILDSEEDEAPEPKRRENSTIRQMREALEAKEAEAKAASERASRLEATFLASSGLTEKQSNALRAAGYEATPEGIDAFRSEVLGVAETPAQTEQTEEADEQEDVDITPEQAGFSPTIVGKGTPPPAKEWTSNDIVELAKSDPVKADKLLRSGKVVRKEFNPGGPRF